MDVHDVAVIGAGPVGLSTAANLSLRGLSFVVLERGPEVGHSFRHWGHVRVFSPWRYNIDKAARQILLRHDWLAPDDDALPTGHEIVDRYLRPLGETEELAQSIRFNERVTSIGRWNFDKVRTAGRQAQPFEIRTANGGTYFARSVVDASGTWFSPNPMGSGGHLAKGEIEAQDRIVYGIPDAMGASRSRYAGRRTLVVGAGHSAVNSVLDLVALAKDIPGTSVVWALRRENPSTAYGGEAADALPARGALGLAARNAVETGAVRLLAPFRVESVERTHDGVRVAGDLQGRQHAIEVDEIIVATGFRPDIQMLREVRLGLDPWLETTPALAPLIDPNEHSCGTVRPHGHRELSHPEPNFFIVGAKSYGRAPTFLMATGYEQARSVVAAIAGDIEDADRVQLDLPETGVCGVSSKRTEGKEKLKMTDEAGCCGGPAPEDTDACCVRDAEAKAAGEKGCGCGTESPKQQTVTVETGGCCGGPAPTGVDACCVKDADAKAAGEAGCGCGSTKPPAPERAQPQPAACCGA